MDLEKEIIDIKVQMGRVVSHLEDERDTLKRTEEANDARFLRLEEKIDKLVERGSDREFGWINLACNMAAGLAGVLAGSRFHGGKP